jgi:CAAX protease family protein
MPALIGPPAGESLVRRYPSVTYFALTFTISWLGAFLVAAPGLVRGQPVPKFSGLLMFPVMLLGPSLAGIVLTRIVDGPGAVRELFRRVTFPVSPAWYAALLIPHAALFSVLLLLKTLVSPVFTPNTFYAGVAFGVLAGFVEEIGWTGFALPKLARSFSAFSSAVLLGILWGLWHLPVVDYLGAATPHGAYWLRYAMIFTVAMTAMRVLICWVYANTQSILLAQLLHVSSTGALVVFTPPGASAAQETFWLAIYAAALWLVVAVVLLTFGKRLRWSRHIFVASKTRHDT